MTEKFRLIGWGGQQIGIRPRTRLARFIDDKIETWNGKRWVASGFKVPDVMVYYTWRGMPSQQQINRVKKNLAIVVCEHVNVNKQGVCWHCGIAVVT